MAIAVSFSMKKTFYQISIHKHSLNIKNTLKLSKRHLYNPFSVQRVSKIKHEMD